MAPFRASVKHIVSTHTHASENLWEGDAFTTHLLLESLALKSAHRERERERRREEASAASFSLPLQQREQPLRELGHAAAAAATTMRMSGDDCMHAGGQICRMGGKVWDNFPPSHFASMRSAEIEE